jgi:hypothetical protein
MLARMQQIHNQILAGHQLKSSGGMEELRHLLRRHANSVEKVGRLYERAERAVNRREAFWHQHAELESCVNSCRSELTAFAKSNDSIESQVGRYKVGS